MRSPRRMPWTMAAVGLGIAIAASGCATSSSMQLPWQKKSTPQTKQTPPAEEQTTDTDTADEPTDRQVARAHHWARQAVTASRHIAYARGLKAAQNDDTPMLAKTKITPRSDGETPPEKRRLARKPEAADTDTSDAQSTEASTTTASTDSATNTPDADGASVRRVARSSAEPTRASGWPVGMPDADAPSDRIKAPIDPTTDSRIIDLTDEKKRKALKKARDIELPSGEGAVAIEGTFIDEMDGFDAFDRIDEESRNDQICVVEPGRAVTFYAGSTEIASLDFEADEPMPETLASVRPVKAVDDGTTQLLFYWSETGDPFAEPTDDEETSKSDASQKGPVRYKVGLLKVLGPWVGRVFEQTVARRENPEADLVRTGYLEFLRGDKHRFLRWTPADEKGEPKAQDAEILKWNKWEGVFRVPKPPPTAPDNRS